VVQALAKNITNMVTKCKSGARCAENPALGRNGINCYVIASEATRQSQLHNCKSSIVNRKLTGHPREGGDLIHIEAPLTAESPNNH